MMSKLSEESERLLDASRAGNGLALSMALAKGADVDARDPVFGMTAAIWSIQGRNDSQLRALISAGTDLEMRDCQGRTAAMHAAILSEACLRTLMAAGADLQARDNSGFTLAMHCAENGNDACLRVLVGAGVDLDAKDSAGWTAAIVAARRGHGQCLSTLVEAGADIDAWDELRRTAKSHAIDSGHPELASFIEAAKLAKSERAQMESSSKKPTSSKRSPRV